MEAKPSETIHGMDYYGVTLLVDEVSPDEITVELYKDNSSRHVKGTRLYKDGGEWSCVLYDNYAVIDKALDKLNN